MIADYYRDFRIDVRVVTFAFVLSVLTACAAGSADAFAHAEGVVPGDELAAAAAGAPGLETYERAEELVDHPWSPFEDRCHEHRRNHRTENEGRVTKSWSDLNAS